MPIADKQEGQSGKLTHEQYGLQHESHGQGTDNQVQIQQLYT